MIENIFGSPRKPSLFRLKSRRSFSATTEGRSPSLIFCTSQAFKNDFAENVFQQKYILHRNTQVIVISHYCMLQSHK